MVEYKISACVQISDQMDTIKSNYTSMECSLYNEYHYIVNLIHRRNTLPLIFCRLSLSSFLRWTSCGKVRWTCSCIRNNPMVGSLTAICAVSLTFAMMRRTLKSVSGSKCLNPEGRNGFKIRLGQKSLSYSTTKPSSFFWNVWRFKSICPIAHVFLFISITLISITRVGFLLENNGSIVIEQ